MSWTGAVVAGLFIATAAFFGYLACKPRGYTFPTDDGQGGFC